MDYGMRADAADIIGCNQLFCHQNFDQTVTVPDTVHITHADIKRKGILFQGIADVGAELLDLTVITTFIGITVTGKD